jgi:hypothetical protein
VVCWWINFVTFVRFFLILVWKTGTFLQILNLISMLRMQEMVLAGFKFQIFSGGACPQTPLGRAGPKAPHVDFIQNATVRLRRWIRPWPINPTIHSFLIAAFDKMSITTVYSIINCNTIKPLYKSMRGLHVQQWQIYTPCCSLQMYIHASLIFEAISFGFY